MSEAKKHKEKTGQLKRVVRVGRPSLEDSERLADHIRQVGMAMFLERGYGNTTVDSIAAKARVAKATIYSRFVSKPALLEECIREFSIRKSPQNLPDEVMALPFSQRLNRLSDHILNLLIDPETIGLERLATAEAVRFPQVARIANRFGTDRAREVIRAFFEDAIERGDYPRSDTTILAGAYMDLMFGLLRRVAQGEVDRGDRDAIWGAMHRINAQLFSHHSSTQC